MNKFRLILAMLTTLSLPLFAEETLLSSLGSERINADGQLKQHITGVYFSAHWCPPCKAFTPKLVEAYQQAKKEGFDFDVVFVSFDHSEEEMLEYMKETEMPWLALPFDSKDSNRAKIFKRDVLESNGIPLFVILNSQGQIITKDGRNDIEQLGVQALYKWEAQKTVQSKSKPSTQKDDEPKQLPPPEKEELTMTELLSRLVEFDGKVVETKINTVSSIEQLNDGRYRSYCSFNDHTAFDLGEIVLIPEEGKEFFEELYERGYRASSQSLFFLVHAKKPVTAKSGISHYSYKLEAIGEHYKKSKGTYSW